MSTLFSFDSDIVHITVVPNPPEAYHGQETFHVHRKTIRKSSGFLQRHFDPEASENVDSLTLPNEIPKSVNIYLNWLYQGGIVLSTLDVKRNGVGFATRLKKLAILYGLGRNLEDDRFMNAIADEFLAEWNKAKQLPGLAVVRCFFEHPSPADGLQQLVLRIWASAAPSTRLKRLWQPLPDSFKQRLAVELMERRGHPINGPNDVSSCTFHNHIEGESCGGGENSRKRRRQSPSPTPSDDDGLVVPAPEA